MYAYQRYTLHLRSRTVIARAGGGDPSRVQSLAYIPGAAVRGAFARSFGDPDATPDGRSRFRQLVTSGEVRFLDALPAPSGRRALPAPRSLRRPKDGPEEQLVDLAAFSDAEWPPEDLVGADLPFVALGARTVAVYPALGGQTHQQRDRSRGRAWVATNEGREVAHGAVFAVEYLEADQRFEGLVQVSASDEAGCDVLLDRVRAGLSGTLLLGRSRRAGYGGDAEITWGPRTPRETAGEGVVQRDVARGDVFRVLFTSPCVVRDPRTGQLDPAAAPALLGEALRSDIVRTCWSFELTGGFNRKWRTELPQALAISPGSVLVARATEAASIEQLVDAENRGIGERLAEGFGRFVLLEPPTRQVRIERAVQPTPAVPTGPVPALVAEIEQRVVAAAVDRQIARRGAELAAQARGLLPTTSLLGRLRVPLRGEPAEALRTLATWCGDGDLALKRPARAQLDRCKVAGRPLRAWILELVTGDDLMPVLIRLLALQALCQRNHLVSEAAAMDGLRNDQTRVAVRLVDATLAAMAQRQRRERSER